MNRPDRAQIERRTFLSGLTLSVLGAPLAAKAQQPGKVARVGMLFLGSPSTQGIRFELVRDELRKLGYVEGQTITFEVRWANGRLDRVHELATELVGARVDLIVTSGSQLVQVIRRVAGSIPIVVGIMSDPISAGFAASFARPGGNITGLAFQDSDLGTKRLQLLKEVVPGLSRVAFLYDPRVPTRPPESSPRASCRRPRRLPERWVWPRTCFGLAEQATSRRRSRAPGGLGPRPCCRPHPRCSLRTGKRWWIWRRGSASRSRARQGSS